MHRTTRWPRILLILGLVCMVFGAIDPLEGSIVILIGTGLGTLAAFIAKSDYLRLFATAFILVALGVLAMFSLSAYGGIGGETGKPMVWGIIVLPYPVGWVLGIVGAVRWLISSRHDRADLKHTHSRGA